MEKAEGKKKEYTVNFGLTEEVKNYLEKAMDRIDKEMEEKPEKLGNDVKKIVVDIVKREITKIDDVLVGSEKITDKEWFNLMEKLDKLTDLVRFF